MNHQYLAVLVLIVFLSEPHLVSSQEPPAAAKPIVTNSIGMKLAPIPSGQFVMGSPRDEAERDDKEERHEVVITKPFYIGVHEIQQSEYIEVMQGSDNLRDRSVFKGPSRPVENVEWKTAKIFCERLTARAEEQAAGRSYRLPTEAEWEYACRGGTSTAFHFGKSISSEQVNFNGQYPLAGGNPSKYLRRTTVVGSYKPNSFGLYDMHGNVAEWCSDWYDPGYYLDSPEEDPLGPPFGIVDTKFTNNGNQNFFVVVRGGCWVDDARACRTAYRFRAMPNTRYQLIGFRVVCEMKGK